MQKKTAMFAATGNQLHKPQKLLVVSTPVFEQRQDHRE